MRFNPGIRQGLITHLAETVFDLNRAILPGVVAVKRNQPGRVTSTQTDTARSRAARTTATSWASVTE